MLRDASQQQVVQKFSFIESLNLSRGVDRQDSQVLEQIEIDRAFDSIPQTAVQPNQTPAADSAIVNSPQQNATIDTNWYQTNSDDYSLSLAEIVKNSTPDPSTVKHLAKPHNYLGKILFALACSYGLFTLWWLFGDRASQILTNLSGGRYITISKSDVEFIDYMEQSIGAIESKLDVQTQSNSKDEVVYVPVYTPNAAPPKLPLATLPSNTVPVVPQPKAIAPQPYTTQALKIPAPPPLPEPTPIPPANPSQTAPKTVATVTKPDIKHTLTGILELEAGKSAALIKINGQTRRFWLNEKIGNSGWVLESVGDQNAKITDGGQIRSISVGETF